MFRLKYLVATCVLALTVGTANAVTFDASGTFATNSFYPNNPPNLSGTLTVDVSNGLITAVDLKVTGFADFNNLISNSNSSQPLQVESSDLVDYLFLSFSQSLIGYNGGPIDSGHTIEIHASTNGCIGCDFHELSSGSLTPTPLPAALPLFAGGLGVIGFLAGRRKRKNVTALAAA